MLDRPSGSSSENTQDQRFSSQFRFGVTSVVVSIETCIVEMQTSEPITRRNTNGAGHCSTGALSHRNRRVGGAAKFRGAATNLWHIFLVQPFRLRLTYAFSFLELMVHRFWAFELMDRPNELMLISGIVG